MKPLSIYTIVMILLLGTQQLWAAGQISKIYSHPAAFTPDEEVTFYFDVTGTDLDGEVGPLYLWTWEPNQPDAKLGTWDNSSEEAKLTQVDGNLWSFTMVPTDFYGVDASAITQIFGLLKTKDGSKQTGNFDADSGTAIQVYDFSKVATKILDYYPKNFKGDEPLTIILNANLAWSDGGSSQGQLVGKQPSMHSGVNGWQNVIESGQPETLLKDLGDGIYKIDFIPSEYYAFSEKITEINCLFNDNGDWAASGRDVGGENFLIVPKSDDEEKEFSFFPQKFTVDDVVTLFFNQNLTKVEGLKTATEIHFILSTTDGAQVIEGVTKPEGDGKFRASMILNRIFEEATSLEALNLVIQTPDGSAKTEEVSVSLVPLH
ncbi:hypothetical protein AAG747_14290 [Rapidithrix thailandica]|uniref:Uncharacterized protein n=1 Tax=Rapidithrix thailandica TaxID=413964 RepID=A0AAW9S9H2_9BACT